jgi:hypothetical protein
MGEEEGRGRGDEEEMWSQQLLMGEMDVGRG